MTAWFDPIASGGPSAMISPSAITTTQSLMSRTTSMSCSTNTTLIPSDAQPLHVTEQRLGERRVHAGHRLVEHDHPRRGHHRPRHLEQLALTAGQRAGELVLHVRHVELVEDVEGAAL